MRLNVACITNIWRDNIYVDTNLCDCRLTCIIHMNKTHAEKCRFTVIINPQRMCKGYGSHSVCLSVTSLAATYLVCESKLRCYEVSYGVPNT